jgi:hypothetical protein
VIGPPNFETVFVFENTQGFAATTMPAAVDPDGDALTYSIVNNFGGKVGGRVGGCVLLLVSVVAVVAVVAVVGLSSITTLWEAE